MLQSIVHLRSQNYCNQIQTGYSYDCFMYENEYTFTATPIDGGTSGSAVYTIQTGGVLTEE